MWREKVDVPIDSFVKSNPDCDVRLIPHVKDILFDPILPQFVPLDPVRTPGGEQGGAEEEEEQGLGRLLYSFYENPAIFSVKVTHTVTLIPNPHSDLLPQRDLLPRPVTHAHTQIHTHAQ